MMHKKYLIHVPIALGCLIFGYMGALLWSYGQDDYSSKVQGTTQIRNASDMHYQLWISAFNVQSFEAIENELTRCLVEFDKPGATQVKYLLEKAARIDPERIWRLVEQWSRDGSVRKASRDEYSNALLGVKNYFSDYDEWVLAQWAKDDPIAAGDFLLKNKDHPDYATCIDICRNEYLLHDELAAQVWMKKAYGQNHNELRSYFFLERFPFKTSAQLDAFWKGMNMDVNIDSDHPFVPSVIAHALSTMDIEEAKQWLSGKEGDVYRTAEERLTQLKEEEEILSLYGKDEKLAILRMNERASLTEADDEEVQGLALSADFQSRMLERYGLAKTLCFYAITKNGANEFSFEDVKVMLLGMSFDEFKSISPISEQADYLGSLYTKLAQKFPRKYRDEMVKQARGSFRDSLIVSYVHANVEVEASQKRECIEMIEDDFSRQCVGMIFSVDNTMKSHF